MGTYLYFLKEKNFLVEMVFLFQKLNCLTFLICEVPQNDLKKMGSVSKPVLFADFQIDSNKKQNSAAANIQSGSNKL